MGRRRPGVLVDAVDAHILEFLQRDARTPITEIARKVQLSDVSVRRRIERLVREEVITFHAHVDPLKVGFSVWAVTWIQVEPRLVESVAAQIARLPRVVPLCLGTGEYDIDAVVVLPSAEDFKALTLRSAARASRRCRAREGGFSPIEWTVDGLERTNRRHAPSGSHDGPGEGIIVAAA